MANRDDEDDDEIKFGNPNLLSQEEYFNRIHAPDALGRQVASTDENDSVPNEVEELQPQSHQSDALIASNPADTIDRETSGDDLLQERLSGQQFIPHSPLPPKQSFEELLAQYSALQGQRNKDLGINAIAAGGAKIGQSLAGHASGNFKPDLSGIEMLNQLAEKGPTDFESQQKMSDTLLKLQEMKEMSNPDSTISEAYRNYFKQRILPKGKDGEVDSSMFPNIEKYSAADLQQLLKSMGKPIQNSFQQVYGTLTNPDGSKSQVSAKFDKATGKYFDMSGNELGSNFVKDFALQYLKDPETGEYNAVHKNMADKGTPVTGPKARGESTGNPEQVDEIKTPNDLWNSLDDKNRTRIDKEYRPAFNKETEKTQQRLTHVAVIMKRLEEAQTNPAALPQLKAELARFDVGDQRLAVQEFNLFAQRQGYEGLGDWLNAKSTGTISADFAQQMGHAIMGVDQSLRSSLSKTAEKQAKLLQQRMPNGDQIPVSTIAPLIYGEYKPETMYLIEKQSGKKVPIRADKYDDALKSGLFDKAN